MAANPVLTSLRNRILEGESYATVSWSEELEQLYKNGIGLDEALQYLYFEKPSVIEFETWIEEKAAKLMVCNEDEKLVLTESDLHFFETNGYFVLKNAISKEDCMATQNIIWDFLEMDPDDSASWYKDHPEQKGLMVNFFDHPVLEKNRASARIKKAYEQLYQSEQIYKTIDKVSFNPPVTSKYSFKGSNLHWDVSLQLPIPFRLQGLIYLSDCGPLEGAFHCVPGFHRDINEWMSNVPTDKHPRDYALEMLKPIPIIGNTGDMVIWNQALPHCATANNGSKPRMVQYLTYFREGYKEQEKWI
ncbi:phytanoyl-CoA dioxygenase family protein [Flavobacterium sp. H122]|uniref:phytanoyl-CoA dioxygenase family protein n=1 Tax=Flavobacterium sp. H122 TaxID=2529860 RepID=UPI0010AA0B56|nr:phytanoyl-CoA dioxygenase family protein [Flavobacterium sp. H122]